MMNNDGTAQIEAGHLHRMLTSVSPFVSSDAMLPVLCAVRLYATSSANLMAEATDRFALAQSAGKADVTEEFSALVSTADVKRILELAKVARGRMASRPIRLELVGDVLTVTDEWSSASIMTRAVDLDYPRLSALVDKARDGESLPTAELCLNPHQFVKLAKALGAKVKHVRLQMPTTALGGVLVTCPADEEFTAILMPQRPRGA
jgi:DNA polymerase III sliding clamp (beta) subunit (PCNA family)